MTPQCGKLVDKILVVTVNIGVVTYEAVYEISGSCPGYQSGQRSGDLLSYDTTV